MPNWVDNKIKITGSQESLKKFAEKVTDIVETADFSVEGFPAKTYVRVCTSFYPQPEVLSLVHEGSNQSGDKYWWLLDENGNKVNKNLEDMLEGNSRPVKTKKVTIEEMFDLIIKHDSFNWYDWRNLYWGSKSGDVSTQMKIEDNYIEIYCESAWNPLGRLFESISRELNLTVEIKWFEESGYYGTIEFENGNLKKNDKDWKDIYNIDYIANQGVTNEEE